MSSLSLKIFGEFEARLGGNLIPGFRTNKVQALLVYLVVETTRHSRESVMELLWPGMPERSARHNLRQILYNLRGAIPEVAHHEEGNDSQVPLLLTNRHMVTINPEAAVSSDVSEFETLLAQVQQHDHLGLISCPACKASLEAAVSYYKGEFLADFYLVDSNEFEDWAQITRQSYRRKVLDALEILTAVATREKDYPTARSMAERQLEIDNLRESSYRQLMEILALTGRREEALSIYESLRMLLVEELSMQPASRTTEMYEKILAGDLSFHTAQTQEVRGYDLKEEIGSGTHGSILRAVQPAIGREVAVKVIRHQYADDPEFIRRFEEEAQIIARLEHPYIVPLYDYWRDNKGAYLVMRYLRGGNLLRALANGAWDAKQAVEMLDQVASALTAAHRMGVVHRDIKPANILFDDSGNAYLSDFSIAKKLDKEGRLAATGSVLGTPDYLSPEQILDERISAQSDLYSLGAVLYETLTGEKPFGDSSMANLFYKHINEPFPLVSSSRPDLPSEIDEVINRATAKLPSDRYADALEMAGAFRRALRAEAVYAVPPVVEDGLERENPYKGLRSFQEADSEDFFGRDALVDRLVARLTPELTVPGRDREGENGRFLAVAGPSGSGKSSVIKAGLIPALRSGAVPGSDKWFIVEMVPGTHPLEELEMALWPVAVDAPPSLVEPMQHDVRGMLRTIRRILPDDDSAKGNSPAGSPKLLLVIDQFEELFTLVDDEERRSFFLDSLLAAISAPRSPLRVVITLRADFYDRPLQYQRLGKLIKDHTELILPLTPEELTWAIREPARRVGVHLEEGLAEAIIADVTDQAGGLPLLQYALTELFEQRRGNMVALDVYQDIGGVRGALGRRAEMLYRKLDGSGQEIARQLFLRLVTLGEGTEDTRRRVLRSELETITAAANRQTMSDIIDQFGAARLLTFDRDALSRSPTVEVAHEALLREWQRLREWLAQSRDDVRSQRLLDNSAMQWLEADKDESYLLRGARLVQFEGWASASSVALTDVERAYLEKSIAGRETRRTEEEARQLRELETARKLAETETARAETESKRAQEQSNAARRLKRLAAGLALLMLVAIIASFLAWRQSQIAEEQTRLATARELASAAFSNLQLDTELSILLALEAVKTTYSIDKTVLPEAETVLHQSVSASHLVHTLLGHKEGKQTSSWVSDLAFSPDGSRLVTAGGDNTVKVWDVQSGEEILSVTGDESPFGFFGVAYSPDGLLIAAGSSNKSIIIWDANTGEKMSVLGGSVGHTDLINRLAFSPDGNQLASTGLDGSTRIWDLASNSVAGVYSNIDGPPWDVAFSPDGEQLAIAGEDKIITVRGDASQPIITLEGHEGGILGIDFSPDGTQVASASSDGTARVWDLEEQREIHILTGHSGAVWEVAFSPDGTRLVTGSADGTARVWDLATGKQRLSLAGHNDEVISVAISPDGTRLATASKDQTARIWDLGPDHELFAFESGVVYDMVVNEDGSRLITTSAYGTATIWDLATGQALMTISDDRHEQPLDRVELHIEGSRIPAGIALSPDGRLLAVGQENNRAAIWEVTTAQKVGELRGHKGPVNGLAFSPDGHRLVTTSEDMTAKMWDVASGEELLTFSGHQEWVWRVFFSPNGSKIVTTSPDDTAIIWDSVTGEQLQVISSHTDKVTYAAFSPDGTRLTTVSGDSTARIWDLDTGENLTLSGHSSSINGVAFSLEGDRLATAGSDGTIRVWDSETGQELAVLSTYPVGVGAVIFTQDGDQLLTAHWDNTIRLSTLSIDVLIQLAQNRLTRSFTEEECMRFLHLESCPTE